MYVECTMEIPMNPGIFGSFCEAEGAHLLVHTVLHLNHWVGITDCFVGLKGLLAMTR